MLVRATAIPLALHPYASTSCIVHWLTRHHGKISTLLKGAQRPKSAFLGEYQLFGTSELLYFTHRSSTLYTGKECALLQPRTAFRTDWRAMQAASYLTALVNKTTPEDAPHPELFELFEELLDFAVDYGRFPQFLLWAELRFCRHHGHAPQLANCLLCAAKTDLRFCASQGGIVCRTCARENKFPTLDCPPDVLAILRAWQAAGHPASVVQTQLNGRQRTALDAIAAAFMHAQFNLNPEHRNAATQAA
ncbi:DNA repair protein RecO [Pontiella sp.]|uniref:DNA repair protein RecO n=1 Tax=Pontiella sp. TaxID=2837462 RepID=UPI00356A553F